MHVKWDEHGVPISTVSAPELQAFMLEQADLRPGMNALEIGSGGANAAMMAWLVGSEGTVTTVDIDPDVTDRASGTTSPGPPAAHRAPTLTCRAPTRRWGLRCWRRQRCPTWRISARSAHPAGGTGTVSTTPTRP